MGKTEVARALAAAIGAELIRLQCHEGIDLHHAVYDWDYQRQLLAIRAAEAGAPARELFGPEFLLRRPLLEALEHEGGPGRAADRRDRPRRRRVRGLPARVPRRLRDHDPRAGDDRRRAPAAGGADVQPHARAARRARSAAACTTGSTTRRPSARRRSSAPGSRACPRRSPRGCARRSRGCASASSTSCPAWGRRSRGRARCSRWTAGVAGRHAGRRAEGARGHRPRAPRPGPRGCLTSRASPPATRRSPSRRARTSRAAPGAGRGRRGARSRLAATADATSPAAGRPSLRRRWRALAASDARARRAGRARARCSPPSARSRPSTRADRTEVFFALRAALCSTRAELNALRGRVHGRLRRRATRRDPLDDLGEIAKQALPRVAVPPQGDEAPAADLTPAPAAWSEEELLREKDFAAYTDAERAMARRLLHADRAARAEAPLAAHGPDQAPARRARPARDVRASLRTGGELLERRYREQATAPAAARADLRRVAARWRRTRRMLLQYMQACVAARARVEAFVFGTRLTRVTRELRGRDSDRALRARRRRGQRLVAAAPGSARRSPSSTASTAAGSAAARW